MLRPNACLLPMPAPSKEAEIYTRIRDRLIKAHCAAKRDHRCCGAIIITRTTITFNCQLCGDARQVIPAEENPQP